MEGENLVGLYSWVEDESKMLVAIENSEEDKEHEVNIVHESVSCICCANNSVLFFVSCVDIGGLHFS
jgi:hypothetical protein